MTKHLPQPLSTHDLERPARENAPAHLIQIGTASHVEAGTTNERTEFGYTRSSCDCESCVANCRHIPGYLLPQDVEQIARQLGYTIVNAFAQEYLLASIGATVMNSETGRVFQIPTLVPSRGDDGACVFLDNADRCRIHGVNPYGCAFFDCRQSHEDANRRSARGLQEIARQWSTPGGNLYTVLWLLLYHTGRRATPPAVARARMEMEARAEEQAGGKR